MVHSPRKLPLIVALAHGVLRTADQGFSASSPGHRRGGAFVVYRGAGRTLLSCFLKQLFGTASRQQWHLSSSSSHGGHPLWPQRYLCPAPQQPLVGRAVCKEVPAGLKLEGTGHPEIPATLMCAQAVLAGAQLSASYPCFLSGVLWWHRLPGATGVIGVVFFFLHSSVAAACTRQPQLVAAHPPAPQPNLKLSLL